jgi:hypothetical protein
VLLTLRCWSVVAALAACRTSGPGGLAPVPCGEVSTCPSDPPPTEADRDTCAAQIAGPCGKQYQAYHDCYGDERVCAYNGTTDVLATQLACSSDSAPYASAIAACLDAAAD